MDNCSNGVHCQPGGSMNKIEAMFNAQFKNWNITLPPEDVAQRKRGRICKAGWAIWYLFGSDETGEYMDCYNAHRMTNDQHVRIYADGRCTSLPAILDFRIISPDPVKDARLDAEYYAENQRVAELLEAKGFGLRGDEPGGVQIIRSQHLQKPDRPILEDAPKAKGGKMRGLSEKFITELQSGLLQPVLNLVKNDSTLCLEIRENYINIYYRGGNILKITEKEDSFDAWFDRKYLDEKNTKIPKLSASLATSDDVRNWIEVVPFLKHEMDLWFGKHPKNEREFQQLMLRENNFGNTARHTDYFICDIEYTQPKTDWRFDLVAVHWPSSSSARKNKKSLGLAFIEMKYLEGALSGKAGLKKHIKDMKEFLGKQGNLSNIKEEMKIIFNQKMELGLIENQKRIESFSDSKPEYIFAFANHDPESRILKKELEGLPSCPEAELKFAVSNFMGYGLFDQNIYSLDEFLSRFKDQI